MLFTPWKYIFFLSLMGKTQFGILNWDIFPGKEARHDFWLEDPTRCDKTNVLQDKRNTTSDRTKVSPDWKDVTYDKTSNRRHDEADWSPAAAKICHQERSWLQICLALHRPLWSELLIEGFEEEKRKTCLRLTQCPNHLKHWGGRCKIVTARSFGILVSNNLIDLRGLMNWDDCLKRRWKIWNLRCYFDKNKTLPSFSFIVRQLPPFIAVGGQLLPTGYQTNKTWSWPTSPCEMLTLLIHMPTHITLMTLQWLSARPSKKRDSVEWVIPLKLLWILEHLRCK